MGIGKDFSEDGVYREPGNIDSWITRLSVNPILSGNWKLSGNQQLSGNKITIGKQFSHQGRMMYWEMVLGIMIPEY